MSTSHSRVSARAPYPFSTVVLFTVISQVLLCQVSGSPAYTQRHINNGVIQLIIEAYTDEVLREMDLSPEFQLNEGQMVFLRQRMRGLHDHIRNHPALHQRYLWVGRGKPDIDPDEPFISHQRNKMRRVSSKKKRYLVEDSTSENQSASETSSSTSEKRTTSTFPSEEICKTNRIWEQVNVTRDFYDNEVEVIQDNVQQYVFSYRCAAETGPCIGISPLYDSECTERYGWMYMYYRSIDDPFRRPQWGFVAAPHHCACKITPKFIPEV